jgi:hypothetical protein
MMDRIIREVEADPHFRSVIDASQNEPQASLADAIRASLRVTARLLPIAAMANYRRSGATSPRAPRCHRLEHHSRPGHSTSPGTGVGCAFGPHRCRDQGRAGRGGPSLCHRSQRRFRPTGGPHRRLGRLAVWRCWLHQLPAHCKGLISKNDELRLSAIDRFATTEWGRNLLRTGSAARLFSTRRTHPVLQRSEDMFDAASAHFHRVLLAIQVTLHCLGNSLQARVARTLFHGPARNKLRYSYPADTRAVNTGRCSR